jgi:HK97 family phage major capsid protein
MFVTEINKENNKRNNIIMNKKFNFVKALRNQVFNHVQDAETMAVLNAGLEETRSANMAAESTFILPGESRAITVANEHDDVIETEFQSILEPLYAKSVLADLGVQFLTGLKGDVQIPVMSAGSCGWAGEVDEAAESTNTFTNVKLQPKRISAVVYISKQMLAQDSIGVENAIRADIAKALASKIQQTFLSADAATDAKPAGIFNGKVATKVADYKALANFEAGLELANIDGEAKYVLSPAAKATLRAMTFGGKSTRMVYENGDIDGTPSTFTSDMAANTFAYGDWSNCVLAQWGGVEIITDIYSKASAGQVKLVINAYFDFVNKRPESVILGTVAE